MRNRPLGGKTYEVFGLTMRNLLGPGRLLGYCTNVHAGATYDQARASLERYALEVKKLVSPTTPMGLGLWLNAATARQLTSEKKADEFSHWLSRRGLLPFTLNGFPYGDFHGPIVKHQVYQPDWRNPKRVAYTFDLIDLMASLLPDRPADQTQDRPAAALQESGYPCQGSISTLPIAWAGRAQDRPLGKRVGSSAMRKPDGPPLDDWDLAVKHLIQAIDYLQRVEEETGKLIHLDLEPEPGCVLQTSGDVVDLFENHLDRTSPAQRNRRYLRVCYDTCHGAVMFEDTPAALARLNQAGVKIGKVQVSSAVAVDFDSLDDQDQRAAIATLRQFQENRYLHQTVIRSTDRCGQTQTTLHDDLSDALTCWGNDHPPAGQWRVHYHVPLFLDRIGLLETTQAQMISSLKQVIEQTDVLHFEVETYAWDVLPEPLATTALPDGIAKELTWLINLVTGEAPP